MLAASFRVSIYSSSSTLLPNWCRGLLVVAYPWLLIIIVLQARYEEIISDTSYLDGVLSEGAARASNIADATLKNVYQAMGFLQR